MADISIKQQAKNKRKQRCEAQAETGFIIMRPKEVILRLTFYFILSTIW